MRRAHGFAMLLCAAISAVGATRGAGSTVDIVNGIGFIDYTSRPKFKVGSWVRYHIKGSSLMGASDDYEVTVLIAGEERFWGEDCFWVETLTEPKNRSPHVVATLMSYEVMNDSLANLRNQYYMRKSIDTINPDGTVAENVVRRPASTLKKRGALIEAPNVRLDTLGIDSLTVPTGTYACRKIRWQEGKSASLDQRDSSITTEVREDRIMYLSSEIPVTGLVRESITNSMKRRTWAIGRSQESAHFNVMDSSSGEAVLVAFGEGMKSALLPESRQKSLAELYGTPARRHPLAAPRPAPARRKR